MTTTHTAQAEAETVHVQAHAGHHSHRPLYLKIFAALMVLLVLTVVAAKIQIPGSGNIIVALTIAVIKAALILMFFMHFRDSDHLTWLVGASTVAWFLILIALTFQDYMTRDMITSMPGK
jgi:cytochrome c oxidase subunit IV